MSRRITDHSLEERLQAVESIVNHGKSLSEVFKELGISKDTLENWVYKFKHEGINGLKESKTWKRYSDELKHQAVQGYLDGKYSLPEGCRKYGISSTSVLRGWIKRYTSGESLKSTSKGKSNMTKGRKTTYQERIEIAQYCLAIDNNYQKTADKYEVSYQQVYQWVQKYKKDGIDGLVDRRGRGLSSKSNLTEIERLKLKNKELEQRNQYLEAENGLIKKLKEIERREKPHE